MDHLNVKTRENSNPGGKPRVYFTCHPKDFRYFGEISESILKLSDCAIYYTEDMTAPLQEEYRATDLGRMNLFVMPITFRLLTEPNRAMDSDFAFADENHITVLPLMMETGIDEFYEKRFGNRHYLSPYSHDLTEIGYEEKLGKFLSALLFDDKTVERVRKAFDACIFLSYRKKDRHHANELMGLIHKNPMYRDVAIWYDEFLTPSEDFDVNIQKALEKSDLFTLLVTPNLVNEKNYVQTTEYPSARDSGKKILPVEMVETSREELEEQYKKLPACVQGRIRPELDGGIQEALKNIVLKANDNDPEHNFLIGLAYLEGIYVETNADYALELITRAAEADLPEAMEKLYNIYRNGIKVAVDYNKALYWAKRLAEYCKNTFGEKHPYTLDSLGDLAVSYIDVGDYRKAIELGEKAYALRCKVLGKNHPNTLTSLNNLASSYGDVGDYRKALELNEKVYALMCEALGEKHPDTLMSLSNLANSYSKVGDYRKALKLDEKVYALRCEVLGKNHPNTLTSLNNLAVSYSKVGKYKRALRLNEKVYALMCEALGEKHPDTLTSLSNLAISHGDVGDYPKAIELGEKAYALMCEALGEKHPDTLTSLSYLANSYSCVGDYRKALELGKKVYALRHEALGESHPDTLDSLEFLNFLRDILDNQ